MQIHVSFLFIVFLGAVAISTANPLEQHERCKNEILTTFHILMGPISKNK